MATGQTFTDVQPLPQSFTNVAPISSASPTDPLSKATSISAGLGPAGRAWNEVKTGLASAQEGGGLAKQPTALGNAAQGLGMIASQVSQLGIPEAVSGTTSA